MVTGGSALVRVDLDHGGRWTCLRIGGREWLWSRDEPRRTRVAPGDRFADAGGLEECVPTVRGRPDHGDAWSRAWVEAGDGAAEVRCPDFTLRRVITTDGGLVSAGYRLSAEPGYRFVWAAHALLDVCAEATLVVPGNPEVRLYPDPAPVRTVRWPGPDGLRLDRLGPDDGTAVGAIVKDCAQVVVRDRGRGLRMSLTVSDRSPTSVALWRNLGGFPDSHSYPPANRGYRSIGVEPMLGSVFDLAEARQPDDAVTVPQSGYVEWELAMEEINEEAAS